MPVASRTAARARKTTRPNWVRRLKRLTAWVAILLLTGIAGFCGVFFYEVQQAEGLMGSLDKRMGAVTKQPTVIVGIDGKMLYRVQAENRIYVRLSEIPKDVQNAILAAEDKRFYSHTGYDPQGLARAVFGLAKEGKVSGGGSTLTMQLAKQLYSDSERTFRRKLQDIAVASTMERRLTKDQILELYLNQVYFGEGAHGIGAAALVYFGKPVGKITLPEAAMLARCVRRPRDDNPIYDYDRSMRNKQTVLSVMLDEGMIDKSQFDKAVSDRPRLNPQPPHSTASVYRAPYFVQQVISQVQSDLPGIDLKDGGYRIETTLDTDLQAVAESQVSSVVQSYRRMGVTTGAFVLVDGQGRILCEVGGTSFKKDQFNAVTQGARQPGSSFKPLVYAAAMASGTIGYNDHISNERRRFWDAGQQNWYSPRNHGNYGSRVSLETALKYSLNQAAVNTCADTGLQTVVGYARDTFGIPGSRFKSVHESSYSLALGAYDVSPIEMAQAYSVFMTGGDRVQPHSIVRIIGPEGQVVKRYESIRYRGVLDSSVVARIDDALREVVEGGTGTLARIVPDAHGKTGTTNDGKDAWFCGYTTNLVGISWVANYKRVNGKAVYGAMPDVYGGHVPILIWSAVMKEAYKKYGRELAPPSDEPAVPKPSVQTVTPDVPPIDSDVAPLHEDTTQPTVPDPQGNTNPNPDVTAPAPAETPPKDTAPDETKPAKANETVVVYICADSGMRASAYCPETVPKTFPKGKEPTRICTLHGRRG